jgi:hypothetical protein
MKSLDITEQVKTANENTLALGGHFQNEFVYEIAKLVPSNTLSITFDESLFDAKVRQAVQIFAAEKMIDSIEYNLRNTVDVQFYGASKEQRTYIKDASTNGWLSSLDFDVLNGDYAEIDANVHEYETQDEARNKAYSAAEKKLLGYLAYVNPKRTIALGVNKFLSCSIGNVVVLEASLRPTVILGKPAYSFEAQVEDSEIVKGEMMITNTLARFVFEE